MRIQVISDLHQEFGPADLTFNNVDAVIMAGDVDVGTKGIEWIKNTITDIPVIYVLGNHEYYKGSYPKILNAIKSWAADSNVHVLENRAVVIGDITFHGATLWTDFALMGDSRINGSICQSKMNDYKLIRRDPPTPSCARSIPSSSTSSPSCGFKKASSHLPPLRTSSSPTTPQASCPYQRATKRMCSHPPTPLTSSP